MGAFVLLLAATTSKGGEAGENLPVESSRWRLALCSDIDTAAGTLWRAGGSAQACDRPLMLGKRAGNEALGGLGRVDRGRGDGERC